MGDMDITFKTRPRRSATLRAAAFALLGLVSLPALAEPLTIYLYKENGMPVYSNIKPEHVEYTIVRVGAGAPRTVDSDGPSPITAEILSAGSNVGNAARSEESLVGWAASCQGVDKAALDRRAGQWQTLVTKHANAHGVPVALVRAVMRVESCFNPRAVSRAGARGLMQLMPETAAQLGVHDSFDADQNISGGVRYLRQLLGRFNNDTRLAIAAYNAGPGAVDTYRGIPPYPETRSYVQRVYAEYRGNTSSNKPKRSKT